MHQPPRSDAAFPEGLRAPRTPPWRATWLASAAGGLLLLLAFFVYHWFAIAPVWSVLVEGALFLALAAAGTAWAWRVARRAGRFEGPWGGLAFGALYSAAFLIEEVLGLARGRTPDPTGVVDVLVELPFALAPIAGLAVVGWRLERSWRGGLAFGVGSLPFLSPAGAVMHFGGTGVAFGVFVLFAVGLLVVGALLPPLERRFSTI